MVKWLVKAGGDAQEGRRAMRSRIGMAFGVAAVLALSLASGTALSQAGASNPSPADDVAASAPSDTGVTSIERAPSGNLRKDLGEPAGLTLAGSDMAYFEITVNDITVLTDCPGRGLDVTPEYGYFVVVDVTATMSADVAGVVPGGPGLFMPVTADAFDVVGSGAVGDPTLTDASWACFDAAELAAPFVGVGETVDGLVVLDSAVPAGTLVYAPAGTGWEWQFGQ